MTTLTPILAAVDQLRQQLQDVKLDHPWDQRTRERALERLSDVRADLSAVWSDVSVAEKRQGEDGPRVTYDPATDQAVPVEKKPEPQPITEAAMRAAGPGWRAFTNGGPTGAVQSVWDDGVYVSFPGRSWVKYPFDGKAPHGIPSVFDLVSLSPPEVVANVAEVLL